MNKVKEQLKNVLEDEKRFTQKMENEIFQKIEKKNAPKFRKSLSVSLVALLAFGLFFTIIILERNSEEIVLPDGTTDEVLEQELIQAFEHDFAAQSYELLYAKVGFHKVYEGIVVYQTEENLIETTVYKRVDSKWEQSIRVILPSTYPNGWAIAGVGPYLLTGVLSGSNISNVYINNQEIEVVKLANGEWYYAAIQEDPVNRVVVKYIDNRYERLTPIWVEPEGNIPVVEPSGNQIVVDYAFDTMSLGNGEYQAYNLVVDRTIGTLERGDVVYIDDQISTPIVARVLAVPGESFGIQNGTVIINDLPLEEPIGYARIEGHYTVESFMNRQSLESINEAEVKRIFNLQVKPFRLTDKQYGLIGDNWHSSGVIATESKYIVGKVVGYDKSDAMKEWTEEERSIYSVFHQTHDDEVLRNVTPIQIARLYYFAHFMKHYETAYAFYTSREDVERWSLQEQLEFAKQDEERYGDLSLHYLQEAKEIQEGTFNEIGERNGYIEFDQKMRGFQLIREDSGIWKVSFMPIQ